MKYKCKYCFIVILLQHLGVPGSVCVVGYGGGGAGQGWQGGGTQQSTEILICENNDGSFVIDG